MDAIELMKLYANRIGLQEEDVNYFEGCIKYFAIQLLKEHNKHTEDAGGELWYAEMSTQWVSDKLKELNATPYLPQ